MKTKQKGFTLIEVIISIVILSFVSAVLLRLFMTADTLNDSANAKSVASVMAANAIETFDGSTAPYDLYYDENWQEISASEDWVFTLSFLSTENSLPNLYDIKTVIKNQDGKEILSYETSRFIKGGKQ